MVGNPGPETVWGHRHEVYSLGFVRRILTHLPPERLDLIAAGVATHHRSLTGGDRPLRGMLNTIYQTPQDIAEAMNPVDPAAARELHEWLLQQAGISGVLASAPDDLAAAACEQLPGTCISQWTDQLDHDPARDLLRSYCRARSPSPTTSRPRTLTCWPASRSTRPGART